MFLICDQYFPTLAALSDSSDDNPVVLPVDDFADVDDV